jgi:CubicO group peptidase (beta-lactamase class C family)
MFKRVAMRFLLGIAVAIFGLLQLSLARGHRDQSRVLSPLKPLLSPRRAATNPGCHELTAADLSAFLDGLVPMQLQREDIAGAVIAVVKDGQLLFAKGYGYSDAAKKARSRPTALCFGPAPSPSSSRR